MRAQASYQAQARKLTIDEAFRPGTEPGLNAFVDASECFSISGGCETGNRTDSPYTSFDPERDAGVVEEQDEEDDFLASLFGRDKEEAPDRVVDDSLDEVY